MKLQTKSVTRLKESLRKFRLTQIEEARSDGRLWAMHDATAEQLIALEGPHPSMEDDLAVFALIYPDEDEEDGPEFWVSTLGTWNPSPEQVRAFIAGALACWEEVQEAIA